METGATDTDSRKDPKGLFLRWDGREVQWAWMFRDSVSQESEFSFGHRAVSKISMLPEVLRALKGRFSTVNEVVYTQRFARTTIVPAIVLKDDSEAAEKWFKLHHAPATRVNGVVVLPVYSIAQDSNPLRATLYIQRISSIATLSRCSIEKFIV